MVYQLKWFNAFNMVSFLLLFTVIAATLSLVFVWETYIACIVALTCIFILIILKHLILVHRLHLHHFLFYHIIHCIIKINVHFNDT